MKRYLGKRKKLKIYIDTEDIYDDSPLWETILKIAKKQGIAGATVTKAVAGMGAHSELHTFNVWALKQKLPLLIEMIDTEEKIWNFLQHTEEIIEEGLITMSDVEVLAYKHPKFGEA